MAKRATKAKPTKRVEALSHAATAARRNIPTAEYQALAERQEESDPVKPVRFPRRYRLQKGEERPRDKEADPQLVWNGIRIRLTPAQMKKLTETRFICITHNPVTMSRMDRLYGVTMPEQGVSQLVSVDLSGAQKLAAAE